ncbi:MAG: hypothetical protein AMS25_00110 [Gemmatimonas sp. SM23_52]|nr:MAG: hypothetical protein AMS25_00110 [Gemmatimonas sp. SM23_52]
MSPQSNIKSPSQLIAEALLRQGTLTREQLQRAAAEARSLGRGLSFTLVSLGLVPEVALLRILSQICRVKAVDLSKIERIHPSVLRTVSPGVAARGLVLPLSRSGDTLTVAMVYPDRAAAVQLSRATGFKIQPVVATEFALLSAIQKHYSAEQAPATAGPAAAGPPPTRQPPPTKQQPQNEQRPQTGRPMPVAGPAPIAVSPAQRPAPAVVPAPAISSQAHGPASAPSPAAAGASRGERSVPDQLAQQKQAETEAALMMVNLSQMQAQDTSDDGNGFKLLALGAAMLLGGWLITSTSFNAAGPGESYVVTTGLFFGGGILVIRGLFALWSG